jgi:hypothetical protein
LTDDSGVVVCDGLEVVWMDGILDMLDEGALEEVALFECFGCRAVKIFGKQWQFGVVSQWL